eukprot:scaffold275165_cov21-Tisochrysis_lutea.AAC.1
MQPCGTPLPCGHLCPVPGCHDPPPPAIAPFQQVGAAIVVLGGGEALRTGPLDRGGGLLLRGLGDAGSCELQRAGGGLAVGRQAHTSHPRKASWLTRTSGFVGADHCGMLREDVMSMAHRHGMGQPYLYPVCPSSRSPVSS